VSTQLKSFNKQKYKNEIFSEKMLLLKFTIVVVAANVGRKGILLGLLKHARTHRQLHFDARAASSNLRKKKIHLLLKRQ
jgi:hypothetical protein